MNDSLNAATAKVTAKENYNASRRAGKTGGDCHVPGPGGSLIHTHDPDVAEAALEERHDPDDDTR